MDTEPNISLVRVQGAGGSHLAWPDLAFTGAHCKRVTYYAPHWYYEWELLASGTLTAGIDFTADLYLIGGGGKGVPAQGSTNYSFGGGSGFPATVYEACIAAGPHEVVVGASTLATSIQLTNLHTAAPGGAAKAGTATTGAVGAGFTGVYALYGDANYPMGTGGGATRGTTKTPGEGGGGCLLNPLLRPGYPLDATETYTGLTGAWNRVPLTPANRGYGAGGMGGVDSATAYSANGSSTGVTYTLPGFTPAAAQGVLLLRIQIV
jgi:hypothetical protein